eukprot:TRINITY_DN7525_c0_g1_i1.p1 TRINITY_DN7525_c0_g1~~TRINITY_DN7525_c0_g1_i1.p1  ORF type:complete len:538 (+),score=174.88 TRINITY_DN7525_c0_g1_i1:63-1616(+)
MTSDKGHGILSRHLSKRLVQRAFDESENLTPVKTKIICTIGPVTNNVSTLSELMSAGMSVARLNFSHGDHKYHQSVIDNVRKAAKDLKKTVAIMLDTKGPEIRTGKLTVGIDGQKDRHLKAGQAFSFLTDETILGNENQVPTTYKNLPKVVKPGDKILVDDGLIAMSVIECLENEVKCTVDNAGMLGEVKGVNLPGIVVDLPAVTEKDKKDIAFGVEAGVDFIAASFIRKAEDVHEIRALPGVVEAKIKIISKIESQEGLDNFNAVLEASDAIMVARGDLGVEIPLEKVASAQKMMIQKCNTAGKPVITATQMLESMIVNPRPTRAEATDVANAVYDGTDCVMLSGETAKGKYPVITVTTMCNICRQAEGDIDYRLLYTRLRRGITPPIPVAESVASSAVKSAYDLNAALIIALTESGSTGTRISKYRPHTPILCVTADPRAARQLLICRATFPVTIGSLEDEEKIEDACDYAVAQGLCKPGDTVVVTSGVIQNQSGSTNIMKIHTVKIDEEEPKEE